MEVLSLEQKAFYEANGYLALEGHLPVDIIEKIRSEVRRFVGEARGMERSNDRLDLEDSHKADAPRIRRIKLPHLISDVIGELMRSDLVLAPVRDLLGPDLRLHTSKLNMKSASYGAEVAWHQDFAFYPHTNDDVLAVGITLDDMAHENGPLMVFPGTHRGSIFDHHAGGVFAGAMQPEACGLDMADAVELTGPVGTMTVHHGRIVHGSALNTSDRDRRLLFYEMMAADAFPVMGSMTKFSGLDEYNSRMLCGEPTLEPRLEPVPVRIPLPLPERQGSIYEIQKAR